MALKVVRTGHDSGVILARFRNERQILASLEHPNIARLLDGGTTEEGTPYLVMELIEGQPIGNFAIPVSFLSRTVWRSSRRYAQPFSMLTSG